MVSCPLGKIRTSRVKKMHSLRKLMILKGLIRAVKLIGRKLLSKISSQLPWVSICATTIWTKMWLRARILRKMMHQKPTNPSKANTPVNSRKRCRPQELWNPPKHMMKKCQRLINSPPLAKLQSGSHPTPISLRQFVSQPSHLTLISTTRPS